jgi:hypothetical protein
VSADHRENPGVPADVGNRPDGMSDRSKAVAVIYEDFSEFPFVELFLAFRPPKCDPFARNSQMAEFERV